MGDMVKSSETYSGKSKLCGSRYLPRRLQRGRRGINPVPEPQNFDGQSISDLYLLFMYVLHLRIELPLLLSNKKYLTLVG